MQMGFFSSATKYTRTQYTYTGGKCKLKCKSGATWQIWLRAELFAIAFEKFKNIEMNIHSDCNVAIQMMYGFPCIRNETVKNGNIAIACRKGAERTLHLTKKSLDAAQIKNTKIVFEEFSARCKMCTGNWKWNAHDTLRNRNYLLHGNTNEPSAKCCDCLSCVARTQATQHSYLWQKCHE